MKHEVIDMKNKEFISNCYTLLGKPYSEVDCIGVIRKALNIRIEGSNWLFRSINNSPKYRYLVLRKPCSSDETPPPGAVVFKIDESKTPNGYETGPDAYHCGVVDEDGYVIHSSPKTGVRKDFNSRWKTWDYWGLMKQVEYNNENVCSGNSNRGDCDVATNDIHDYVKSLTDREILEALYNKFFASSYD